MPCDQFSAKRRNKRLLPIDVPSSAPTNSLVGSSPIDVAPRMIIRSLRLRAGKIVLGDAKRLLQHNRHEPDHQRCPQFAIGGIADMAVTNRLPLGGDAPPAAKAIVDLTQWAKPGGEGGSGTDRGATQRGAAQAVGLAGPMNAPMKKTARRVK